MNFYFLSMNLCFVFSIDYLEFSYDHELKIEKARENARRTEQEKEAERYETLMHDFLVR